MKIGSKTFEANVDYAVFPRANGSVAFAIRAIYDYTDFEKLCPVPKPPTVIKPGGEIPDVGNPAYQEAVQEYGMQKLRYMLVHGILETPDFSWEKVNLNDPTTWKLWREEFTDAHFTDAEIAQIEEVTTSVNGLNNEKIEEARAAFLQYLAGRGDDPTVTPVGAQSSSSSGEPANG